MSQGGCERRIEVIVKMQNKKFGGMGVGWGRVAQEGREARIEVIEKCKKKKKIGVSGWM